MIGRPPEPALTRFERFVERDPNSGCWLWTGKLDHRGYGQFWLGPRKTSEHAHRASWKLHVGPIPPGHGYHGTCVCHWCDTPACVNPAHLFLGTVTDNNRDTLIKGRHRYQIGRLARSATGQYLARVPA